jgi:hypothetical protein
MIDHPRDDAADIDSYASMLPWSSILAAINRPIGVQHSCTYYYMTSLLVQSIYEPLSVLLLRF